MEATCYSETSVDFQRATWRYISEDRIIHNHLCENLSSYKATNTFLKLHLYFRMPFKGSVISLLLLFTDFS
jgi:hypothetical protein